MDRPPNDGEAYRFEIGGEIADQAFSNSGMSQDECLTLVSFATCAIRGLRMQNIMADSPDMTQAVLRELKAHLKMSLDRGMPGQENSQRPRIASRQGSAGA